MLVRLALETRHHHADADADRLALMEIASVDAYRDFLARVYGFEAAVETAVEQLPANERGFFVTRGKHDRLRNDLLALGMTDSEISLLPKCTTVRIKLAGHALGWVFVIERHTLVAGLLRRHLEAAQPACMKRANEYLSAHADAAGARFRGLGEALNQHAKRAPMEPHLIVAAANDAFRCQRQWYAGSRLHEQLRGLLNEPRKPRTKTPTTVPPPIERLEVIEVTPMPEPEPAPVAMIATARAESTDLVT